MATTGRETLVLNVTGLGTNEPADGVEDVGAGTDELRRLGLTETKKQKNYATAERQKLITKHSHDRLNSIFLEVSDNIIHPA